MRAAHPTGATPSLMCMTSPRQPELLTVGHGTLSAEELRDLLMGAAVSTVVDVRRFPGSRRHPHVAREELERWLPEIGVDYRWAPELGGRRRLDPEQRDVDSWWKVEAFAAYAAYARTEDFKTAMQRLLDRVASESGRVAVMCSESVWWRCHRRIISDVAVLLHDVPVLHLAHSGATTSHPPAEGARVADDGLVYDRLR